MIHETELLRRGFQLAKEITQEHSKTFSFAGRFLPHRKRLAAYAVYAVCRASDDAVDQIESDGSMDPAQKAATNLARVRANIEAAYSEGPLQDPLLAAFRATVNEYEIPRSYFAVLLEGVSMDLYKTRYSSFAELYDYCYKVAGIIGLIMLRIFGYESAKAEQYAVDLGIAMQLTNILRDVREDHQRGRIYIPQDEMAEHGVSEDDIAGMVRDENWRALLKFQIGRARHYYGRSIKGIRLITDVGSRFVVYAMGEIYGGILGVIERNDYDVFSERAHVGGREKAITALRILFRRQYV